MKNIYGLTDEELLILDEHAIRIIDHIHKNSLSGQYKNSELKKDGNIHYTYNNKSAEYYDNGPHLKAPIYIQWLNINDVMVRQNMTPYC